MNTLYYGDCLTIMREKMQPSSVDLVYLDPPFNSKRDYNAIYKDHTGRPLPDQVEAFNDTWLLDADKMRTIKALPALLREHGIDGHSADFLAGFISGLAQTQVDMAAYLAYMTERLLWIKRVMKPTASIYLHCDPTASHYLKVMMDVVFGKRNFRNEIVWKRTIRGYKGSQYYPRSFNSNTDILLFFVKTSKAPFDMRSVLEPYDSEYLAKAFKLEDDKGRYYLDVAFNRPSATAHAQIYVMNISDFSAVSFRLEGGQGTNGGAR